MLAGGVGILVVGLDELVGLGTYPVAALPLGQYLLDGEVTFGGRTRGLGLRIEGLFVLLNPLAPRRELALVEVVLVQLGIEAQAGVGEEVKAFVNPVRYHGLGMPSAA
jgi:hypothetical protein